MHLCCDKVLTIYSDVADFEVAEMEVCIWGLSLAEVSQNSDWSAAFQGPAFDQHSHY